MKKNKPFECTRPLDYKETSGVFYVECNEGENGAFEVEWNRFEGTGFMRRGTLKDITETIQQDTDTGLIRMTAYVELPDDDRRNPYATQGKIDPLAQKLHPNRKPSRYSVAVLVFEAIG